MREGWSYKKLGEVVDKLTDGSHNPPKGIECSEYKMISSQNIQNGFIDMNAGVRYLNYEDFLKEDARTRVKYGDVLLTIVGTVGRCTVFKIKDSITLQRSVAVMSPKPIINSDFLKFYFIAQASTLSDNAHGIAQKGLYLKQLSNFEIPVPPLSTQQQIVAELDLLSGIIEKQKAQLKELDSLAQSLFYDMFGDPVTNEKGWEVKKLGEVCSKITDGTHNSPINEKCGDYMYITAKNIKADAISLENVTYVSKEIHQSIYERCNPTYGDILYIKDGATTGIATINTLKEEFSLLSSVALLKPSSSVINYYLKGVLNSPSKYNQIREEMGGAAITRLTIKKIERLSIPLPPLPLQQQFAERVASIEHQKSLVKQSLKETETLFNSRMDYYFN